MEQDVAARASDFLSEHFQDRLTETDRLALEHWMTSRIEAERKGWKNSLQRSLQEVERERKLALEVHGAIQGLNERVEARMGEILLSREPSMYHGSDQDSRVYTTSMLEKNIEAILRCLSMLLEERDKCFACLASEHTSNLHIVLSNRLIELNVLMDRTEKKHQAEISELNEELEEMRGQIQKVEGSDKNREVQHFKEMNALGEIIARQRAQIESVNHWKSSEVATQTGISARDIAIQVDSDSDRSENGSVVESQIKDRLPIRSVTISRSVDNSNGKREWKTHTLDFERVYNSTLSTPIKHSEDYHETKSNRSQGRSSARSLDPSDFDRRQTINSLRGQVIEFAERLERAKDEVERYQRQLAWMKTTPHATLVHNEINHMRNSKGETKYQDGFLSGARKDLLPAVHRSHQDTLVIKTHLRKRQVNPTGASNSTSRCLRCHKLYKLRDNHRKACRYHPRGKKKIEKYDDNGKLVTVTYLWECCLQAADAQGCSGGEHI